MIMRLGEFCSRTGLSVKTARWLYDNVFSQNDNRQRFAQRDYTEDDIKWVAIRQVENFETVTGRRIEHIVGCYFVSDDGRVWVTNRGFLEEMSYEINAGYKRVNIRVDKKVKHYKVSKLVALKFVPNPLNKPIPNHKDGNKLNDDYTNLEWSTISENTQHAYDIGLAKNAKGSDDSQSKAVVMYKNDGTMLAEFGSLREASREVGCTLGYISGNLRHKVSHGTQGFFFRYKEINKQIQT